jgi:multiple sugar transport system ATP-binding protein
MSVADRIAVMRGGELIQVGTPLEIYHAPANTWVSQFVGTHPINLFEVVLEQDRPRAHPAGRPDAALPLDLGLHARLRGAAPSGALLVGIRPEFVKLTPAQEASDGAWPGEVFTRQVLGTSILYDVRSENGHVRAVTSSQEQLDPGSTVVVELPWQNAFFFDTQTEHRIPV